MEDYFPYWGKTAQEGWHGDPYHLLAYHCLDVAAVGEILLQRHPFLEQQLATGLGLAPPVFRQWAVFFLALHDVGKFAECFQAKRVGLFQALSGRRQTCFGDSHHSELGYALWLKQLVPFLYEKEVLAIRGADAFCWQEALDPWAQAVTGHHGTPPATGQGPASLVRSATKMDLDAAQHFAAALAQLLPTEPLAVDVDAFGRRVAVVSWWLAGLAVLCDWIGSDQHFFPPRAEPMALPDYWNKEALPRAARAFERAGILPAAAGQKRSLLALFPDSGIRDLTPLQQMAAEMPFGNGRQLFILEDVTGAGKTEAAIMLAHRLTADGTANGVFVALPTMATANAMYGRLRGAYRNLFAADSAPNLVLAHGARDLNPTFKDSVIWRSPGRVTGTVQDISAQCSAWLADHRKAALFADFGVGTIDQALLAVLYSRHQSLRLLGLTRKVLLVDEVHACDAYMLGVLQRLVTFHVAAGGSVILLSATLPNATRAALVNAFCAGVGRDIPDLRDTRYPLLTRTGEADLAEVHIPTRQEVERDLPVMMLGNEGAVIEKLVAASETGYCGCWVRNSVADAVEAYERLCERVGAERVMLFHARFAMCDRIAWEESVLKHFGKASTADMRKGRILVATQVVEQSLDLDFDSMVTDLAPIDLIVQRAGRLHRHVRDGSGNRTDGQIDDREPPRLYVLAPDPDEVRDEAWLKRLLPRTAAVYPEINRLWHTARLLKHGGQIAMPHGARDLIEGVYGEETDQRLPDALRRLTTQAEGQVRSDRSLARSNTLNLEQGYRAGIHSWWEDTRTPTRLGEASSRIRLGLQDGEVLRPFAGPVENAWALSEVSVLSRYVSAEDETLGPDQLAAIESAKAEMADRGKWALVVAMIPTASGTWEGRARDAKGEPVRLVYSRERGLSVGAVE